MLNLDKSHKAFAEAKLYMPGGVNSPVRSYRSVGSEPPFIASASGDRIYDIDGNEYIDYVLSWGPMILGHANAEVVAALQEAVLPAMVLRLCLKQKWLRRFRLLCQRWKCSVWLILVQKLL
jgi:glutamate-1-semialdehyde aminotransferase